MMFKMDAARAESISNQLSLADKTCKQSVLSHRQLSMRMQILMRFGGYSTISSSGTPFSMRKFVIVTVAMIGGRGRRKIMERGWFLRTLSPGLTVGR